MTPAALAAALQDAFANLHPLVRVQFQAQGDLLELELAVHEAPGALVGMISGPLDLDLDDPARVLRYGTAVACHLREFPPTEAQDWLDALAPSALMLQSVLEDPEISTPEDFDAFLADSGRCERARRVQEVLTLVQSERTFDDALLDLLYPLTVEGRFALDWDQTVAALRGLVARGEHTLIVDAMETWADEYDPFDQVWEGGPTRSDLLLLGAWKALNPHLQGPLRRRALDAVDRIADESRPSDADLAQAGLDGFGG